MQIPDWIVTTPMSPEARAIALMLAAHPQGLTRRELAQHLGVSLRTMDRWRERCRHYVWRGDHMVLSELSPSQDVDNSDYMSSILSTSSDVNVDNSDYMSSILSTQTTETTEEAPADVDNSDYMSSILSTSSDVNVDNSVYMLSDLTTQKPAPHVRVRDHGISLNQDHGDLDLRSSVPVGESVRAHVRESSPTHPPTEAPVPKIKKPRERDPSAMPPKPKRAQQQVLSRLDPACQVIEQATGKKLLPIEAQQVVAFVGRRREAGDWDEERWQRNISAYVLKYRSAAVQALMDWYEADKAALFAAQEGLRRDVRRAAITQQPDQPVGQTNGHAKRVTGRRADPARYPLPPGFDATESLTGGVG